MKKILIILTSVLILIGIWASYIYYTGQKTNWDVQYEVTPVVQVPTYEAKQIEIHNQDKKDAELYNAAMRDQDPTLCDGITKEDQKTDCHDMIVAQAAKKEWNIEACQTITATGTRVLCSDTIQSDKAIITKDKQLCDAISDWDTKATCQEWVDELTFRSAIETNTITPDICDTLSEKHQESCMKELHEVNEATLYNEAIEKNDISLCDKIMNTDRHDACTDTINLKTAYSTQDSRLCNNIINSDKKLYCQSQVSKTSDTTIYKSAISTNDVDLCSKIATENLRNKCHDTIIIASVKASNDITFCDSLTNSSIVMSCRAIAQ